MKPILIFLTFLVWGYTASASDTTIVFRQINYADLFEVAKKEHKGVMLYFHFDGCGACDMMERTAFKDKSVFDYYNENLVNFEINTLKQEGKEVNKEYKIKMHPTFIFFDHAGNEVHRLVGVFGAEEFYKQANNALVSGKNLINYKKQYHAGNREPAFLLDYAYMLRDAYELDSLIINEYVNTQTPGELEKEKNIKFLYEFIIHRGEVCFPYQSSAYLFMLQNKERFAKFFDLEQVNTRLMLVIQSAVYNAIEKKDSTTFLQAIESLKDYDVGKEYNFKEMDDRITMWTPGKSMVLSAKMVFYEKMGDVANYNKSLQLYIEKIWNDADGLNQFAWNIYEQANIETDKIQTAIKCSIRSIELKNNYANNDTYAWLLYKLGDEEKALKQANKAIEIAKVNNQDCSETQKIIDSVNEIRSRR